MTPWRHSSWTRRPGAVAALMALAMGASMLAPRSISTGASSALPDDPERTRRAEEKRKRRAAKPGASNYAKNNHSQPKP